MGIVQRQDSAADILKEVKARGISLWVEGDKLKYRAPNALPAGLAERLRQLKPTLIEMLRVEHGPTTHLIDAEVSKSQQKSAFLQPLQALQHQGPDNPWQGKKKPRQRPGEHKEGRSPNRGTGNILLPKQTPSVHPLAPVYAAYNGAYQDRALQGKRDRVDIILARTMEAARAAGFEVKDFDRDLYPLLRPWIVALGEPTGVAKWRPDLIAMAEVLAHLAPGEAVEALRVSARAEGYPLGERQAQELLRDVQTNHPGGKMESQE